MVKKALASNPFDYMIKYLLSISGFLLFTIFAIAQKPNITSFSPIKGPIGTVVTIVGTNFNATPANNIVFFGATKATVTAATATQLMVIVPIGTTYQLITVLTNGLVAYSSKPFVVTFSEGADFNSSSYAVGLELSSGIFPYSISLSDLDGDGKTDLFMPNNGNYSLAVLRNTTVAPSNITYATKAEFTTETSPYSASLGDFDGDGKSDIVVANKDDNSISIRRNISTGPGNINYAAKLDLTTGTSPLSVAGGDLDGDGKPDLVVANYASGTLSIFRNTSTGSISFAGKVDLVTGTNPYSLVINDFDGDGKADLAVSNKGSNTVSVLRNTSTGAGTISYASKVDFNTGTSPSSIAIGDLDDDGRTDIAVANSGNNSISILKNNNTTPGSISFANKTDIPVTDVFPNSIAIGDLDGDGKIDLAVAGTDNDPLVDSYSLAVLRNMSNGSGDLSYSAKVSIIKQAGTSSGSIAIGDMDGDGKPELILANTPGSSVLIFRYTGPPPSITSLTPISGPIGTTTTIVGTNFSMNKADNIVFFGATKATVTTATTTQLTVIVPSGCNYKPVSVLVKNLLPASTKYYNLSAYAPNPFSVTFSDGANLNSSAYAAKTDFTVGSNPQAVLASDFDGDGKPDLAVANTNSNTLSVLINTGSGSGNISFGTKKDFTTGTNPSSLYIGDFDGDGKPDLATTNYSSGTVSILMNISTGPTNINFDTKKDFNVGTNPASVFASDFDGDGRPDLAVANYGSNTVSILTNISSGPGNINFDTKKDFTTGTGPRSVSAGDFDGDGKIDLATGNFSGNNVSILKNVGSKPGYISYETKKDFDTGTKPYSVSTGDLDGDGKIDLVITNYTGNTVSVLRNNSSGPGDINYEAKKDLTAGRNPYCATLTDFDGDGKVDIAVTNSLDNTISLFKNLSTTSISYSSKTDFTTGQTPYSVSEGDLDGDGKSDLIVTNSNGVSLSILRNTTQLTITGFTPSSGFIDATVTLIGTNFSPIAANNVVKFNGVTASVTSSTSSNINTNVPAGSTTGKISVMVKGLVGTSNTDFVVGPSIVSCNPGGGPVASQVTITGTNFSATPGNNLVKFNGTTATVSASTTTSITTTVPSGSITGKITVTTNGLTTTSTDDFKVLAPEPSLQPTQLSFSSITATTINVSFTAASEFPSGYLVLIKEGAPPIDIPQDGNTYSSSVGSSIVAYNGSNTSFKSEGLTGGKIYYYQVYSYNGNGATINYYNSSSAPLAGSVITRPISPVLLEASNPTTSTFKAKWLETLSASSYELDVSLSSSFDLLINGYAGKSIAGLEETVTGLLSDKTYYYRVRALNASGPSTYSNIVSVITSKDVNVIPLSLSIPSITIEGANKKVSINLSGGAGERNVKIVSRKILSLEKFSETQIISSSNDYSIAITSDQLDQQGLEFYFSASDATRVEPLKSSTEYIYTPVSSSIPNLSPGGQPENYRIISIPAALSNADPRTVFNSAMVQFGGYNIEKWRLIHYEPGEPKGKNVDFESLTQIQAGQGYWFNSTEKVDVNINGTAVNANQSAPFQLSLKKGWNQIGNPYTFNIKWSDVLAANGNPDAVGAKYYIYDASNISFKEVGELIPWSGGFVKVTSPTVITIPVTIGQSTGGRKKNPYEIENRQIDQPEWFLPLHLSQGNAYNEMGGIGMHPNASLSNDRYDEQSLPRFQNYLELNSYHEDFFIPRFTRDVVPNADHYQWDYVIESNFEKSQTTLTWDSQSLGDNTAQLKLYDEEAGELIDMKRVSSYSFTLGNARKIKIFYSTDEKSLAPDVSGMGKPYPNPFNQQVTIPFFTGNNSHIQINVYDLTGRKIKELINQQQPSGFYQLNWDGTDEQNNRVANGIYLYRFSSSDSKSLTGRLIIK